MQRITSGRRIINGVPFVWSILDNVWVTEEYWQEIKKAQKTQSPATTAPTAPPAPTDYPIPATDAQLKQLKTMVSNLERGLCTIDEYLQHVCGILERPYDGR